MNYILKNWTALTRYCEHPDLSIDNNHTERSLRGWAVGRNNWTFFGSDRGGKTAAVLRSFVASCELVKVDPRGTSQTCTCGTSVEKKLKDRWHECPACGLSAARDVVSAQVILQRARIERSGRNVGVIVPSVLREAVCF